MRSIVTKLLDGIDIPLKFPVVVDEGIHLRMLQHIIK